MAASAALYGHYRVLPAWLTGPEVCLMEDGGCAILFRSPRSRLLGVPNALLGVSLYVLLAAIYGAVNRALERITDEDELRLVGGLMGHLAANPDLLGVPSEPPVD